MPNLKHLKSRISSIRATSKITLAMKMVAGSRLRRAQEQAESARLYCARMRQLVTTVMANTPPDSHSRAISPLLLSPSQQTARSVLLIVLSSDRGLCGRFNSSVVHAAHQEIARIESEGGTARVMCLGQKARDALRREDKVVFWDAAFLGGKGGEAFGRDVSFERANALTSHVRHAFEDRTFDRVCVVYNHFQSVLQQVVTTKQVLPLTEPERAIDKDSELTTTALSENPDFPPSLQTFEPDHETILASVLPQFLALQLREAMLENWASEHAARMTAMDNATRNAGTVIGDLTLILNRTRQAYITKEIIEIISGSEAQAQG